MRDRSSLITAVSQYFEAQVYDVFAIRGNAAIFKCQVPSFVADYVEVADWINSNSGRYSTEEELYGIRDRRTSTKMLRHAFKSPLVRCLPLDAFRKILFSNWIRLSGCSCRAAICSERDGWTCPSGECSYYQVSYTELRCWICRGCFLGGGWYHRYLSPIRIRYYFS